MLNEKQFAGLKKANLSVNAQKSKKRLSDDYRAASKEQKDQLIKLSGLTRNTFYNAFQNGAASPRMVIAMAQTLGVSPFYYTGDSDNKETFTDEILTKFLKDKNINLNVKKTAKKPNVKTKTAAVKNTAKKPTTAKPAAKPVKKASSNVSGLSNKSQVKSDLSQKAKVKSAPFSAEAKNEVWAQVSIEKTPKLQKAVANLDEESAVLLLRALIRKAEANDNAKTLCNIIKSCLLS